MSKPKQIHSELNPTLTMIKKWFYLKKTIVEIAKYKSINCFFFEEKYNMLWKQKMDIEPCFNKNKNCAF